jgi:hypothetical protein
VTDRPAKSDETETVVEWPDTIVSSETGDKDLGPPLKQLLVDLGIKGTTASETSADKASAAVKGTPVSVAIIEAGATAASKGWAAAIAALGGATAVWGAASDFWKSELAIQGNLVIAAAVVIAACALGTALIMYGDVRARGQGAAAQYSARASIATAFLRGATIAVKTPTPAPGSPSKTAASDGLTASAGSPSPDGLADIRTQVEAAQRQISSVSDTTQQILKGTGGLSTEMQEAIVALALAQAGDVDVPVVLKTGGSGNAKGLIRTSDGEWKFRLDGQTWMPVSEIVAFGEP